MLKEKGLIKITNCWRILLENVEDDARYQITIPLKFY